MQISANSPAHLIAQWRAVSSSPYSPHYDPMSYVMTELGKQANWKIKRKIEVPRKIRACGAKVEDGYRLSAFERAEAKRIEREWEGVAARNKRADSQAFMNPKYNPTGEPRHTGNVKMNSAEKAKQNIDFYKDAIIKMRKEGVPCAKIADKFGYAESTIWRYSAKWGVTQKHVDIFSLNRAKILQMITEGFTNAQIAGTIGVSRSHLSNWLSAQRITRASIKAGKV